MTKNFNNILQQIYYNEAHPASYGGDRKLYLAAKLVDNTIKLKDVREWLQSQTAYTLHKNVFNKHKREQIFVTQPLEQYQADLVDMQKYSRFNQGYKYILTVIDCFSRYAFAEPIKSKKPTDIINALKKIFIFGRPFKFQTDRGLEFKNRFVREFLNNNNVQPMYTYNTVFKCAIVERFNGTLKQKMFKYFDGKQIKNYVNVLQSLVSSYNNTKHRTIGIAPAEVNEENIDEIFKKIYKADDTREYFSKNQSKHKLKVGDKVRLKYVLGRMDKGYLPKWSDHIYTIKRNIQGNTRPLYKITDANNDEKIERFYPEDLQKVKENFYRIEKVIKREDRNGKKGFIVKWLDYPSSHNSWVSEEDFVNFNKNG